MRSISESHLAVLIPLLAAEIRSLGEQLDATDARPDDLTEEEIDDRVELQDMLRHYEDVLDTLRVEYEAGLAEGIVLPSFDALTGRFRIDRH